MTSHAKVRRTVVQMPKDRKDKPVPAASAGRHLFSLPSWTGGWK